MAHAIGYVDDSMSEGYAHWQMLRFIRDFAGGYGTFTAPTFTGTGTGALLDVDTDPDAVTETWTIECTSVATPGAEVWSVTGSVSGAQASATTGVAYNASLLSFVINTGATAFVVGDKWTLDVTAGVMDSTTRWQVLRYLTPTGDGDKRELVLKGQGLSGTEEIYIGLRCYQSASADYYNMSVAGFTGYVSSNTFGTQPGYLECGVCAHNQRIDYWLAVNAQRIILGMKVGTPVYQHAYVGRFLPYATPSQYPYPLCVMGMFPGLGGYRYSSGTPAMGYYGNRNQCRMRFIDGVWRAPDVWPWNSQYNASYDPRDGNGTYSLFAVSLNGTDGFYGELDGVHMISGFGNATENTLTIGGKDYIVLQDAARTGFKNYVALEMN